MEPNSLHPVHRHFMQEHRNWFPITVRLTVVLTSLQTEPDRFRMVPPSFMTVPKNWAMVSQNWKMVLIHLQPV